MRSLHAKSCLCWAVALPSTKQIVSPFVCAVLALDSWNYCSGEQAQQPNFFSMFACMASLIKRKWNSQHLPPCGKGIYTRWQHLIFFYLCTWLSCVKKIGQSYICCAVGPALQSNSSNCPVLIPHRQLGN